MFLMNAEEYFKYFCLSYTMITVVPKGGEEESKKVDMDL